MIRKFNWLQNYNYKGRNNINIFKNKKMFAIKLINYPIKINLNIQAIKISLFIQHYQLKSSL
jgi:hypothetical protein